MEKKVFSRLALCLDPRKVEAAGLSAKVIRSMGIGVEGLSEREAEYRQAEKVRIIDATSPYEVGTEMLPGLGPPAGHPIEDLRQIEIPADLLLEVAKKIVRGSEFVLAERIIEERFEVQIYFAHEREIPDLLVQLLADPGAKTTSVGPAFTVIRAEANDEPGNVIYKISVWDTLVIYASILAKSSDSGELRPANAEQC